MYYDAFESPDAMKGVEEPATPPSPLRDEELSVLQQRTRQLEARRGRITAKKVYLKNKKEICIVNHNQKIQQRQGDGTSLLLQPVRFIREQLHVTGRIKRFD